MINQDIARIFNQIADILEMKDVAWKPIAYRKAARNIESLSQDLIEIYKKGGLKALEAIPGVGKHMATKIEEYIKTGKIKSYKKMLKETPIKIEELMSVEGMGPKKIMLLYKKLKVKNLKDLEKAAKAGKLRNIATLGRKTEINILEGIKFAKSSKGRKLLGHSLPIAREIVENLKSQSYIHKVEIAGSISRRKETVGDIDILITTNNPEKAMDFFTKMKDVKRIIAKGPTKSTIIYDNLEVDARVLAPDKFGSAVQYFTGSLDHNVALRRIAIKKGYKLSEYGLFKGKKVVESRDEKKIYKKLGLQWIPPEIRENKGEIEVALKNKLPKLISLKDIKSDLQMHTKWSDGENTIEEMANACKKLGYQYMAITDHVGQLAIAGAMTPKEIRAQSKKIDKVNSKLRGIKILKGVEVDVKLNGDLAIKESLLKDYDVVLASLHQGLRRSKTQQTERTIKAIENKYVNIIAHPTGRLINERKGMDLNFEKIFKAAKENNVAMEINAYPNRLDLNDINAKTAKDMRVMLSLGTDAHHIDQLKLMEYGVYTARRAWCRKKDVLNTLPLKQFLKKIKR